MFAKVLIANRGEIACRVARTCRRLGIESVAVYSDADAAWPHVALADHAIRIGPAPVQESYLNVPALVSAIERSGADAVHPGYGLLSENPTFARAVGETRATFIGPSPDALERLGDKIRARELARSVGVAPPPGSDGPCDPNDETSLLAEAERVGWPLIVKAAAGGGGIGMLVVSEASGLMRAVKTCADRARQAFADDRVYLERYLDRPRHIEVQVGVDAAGTCVAFGERECSVQRRHQKVIEETPSPARFFTGLEGAARRQGLFRRALDVVRGAGYEGLGTVEFVADASGELFFLEVNARLQVEHPITELVTGLDLVELQLSIANGQPFTREIQAVSPRGHAIEARLYAEDPARGFLPQPGHISKLTFPENLPGVRIDAGVREGLDVTPYYDPLLAKICAHADTRQEAILRLDAALAATELVLEGPKGPRLTNRELLRTVLAHPQFRAGDYDTHLIERLGKAQ